MRIPTLLSFLFPYIYISFPTPTSTCMAGFARSRPFQLRRETGLLRNRVEESHEHYHLGPIKPRICYLCWLYLLLYRRLNLLSELQELQTGKYRPKGFETWACFICAECLEYFMPLLLYKRSENPTNTNPRPQTKKNKAPPSLYTINYNTNPKTVNDPRVFQISQTTKNNKNQGKPCQKKKTPLKDLPACKRSRSLQRWNTSWRS